MPSVTSYIGLGIRVRCIQAKFDNRFLWNISNPDISDGVFGWVFWTSSWMWYAIVWVCIYSSLHFHGDGFTSDIQMIRSGILVPIRFCDSFVHLRMTELHTRLTESLRPERTKKYLRTQEYRNAWCMAVQKTKEKTKTKKLVCKLAETETERYRMHVDEQMATETNEEAAVLSRRANFRSAYFHTSTSHHRRLREPWVCAVCVCVRRCLLSSVSTRKAFHAPVPQPNQ